jgi:predicted unusual protein kinase regulating ubiquinone biosynthesis (AarF/ABC1/UbiB family)
MAPEVISRVIMQELGDTPERVFAKWSRQPLAAASIGQVHLAQLRDGTDVVVKVQYPEITRTLETDLANISIFDKLGSVMLRHQEKGTMMQELRERLTEECDYENEAGNLLFFKTAFADVPWLVIPQVHSDYTTKKVLTMEYIKGLRFSEFIASATQPEKNEAGKRMFEMMFRSVFVHHRFNCDPHPGNYLFLKGQVAFLDFGCVKRYDKEFIRVWKAYARNVLERDFANSNKNVIRLGLVPQPDKFDFEYQDKMMVTLYEPWMTQGNFKFTRSLASSTWKSMVVDNPNKYYTNVPKDWIFASRLQWGLYSVLAEMGAEFDARSIALSLLFGPDEKWPDALFQHQ